MADRLAGDGGPWRLFRRHEANLLLAIVCIVGLTALLDSQHNYVRDPLTNLVQVARQTSLLGIFAIGSAVVIIAGGIDLSSGSVICFSGTICATFLLLLAPEQMQSRDRSIDLPIVALAMAGTLLVGLLIGSLHAWLITVVRLPPFIATLATLVGLRSFAWAICDQVTESVIGGKSSQIQIYDPRFRYLATSVWIPAATFLAVALLAWFLLSKTVIGRHVYALGGNEEAARLSGIRTDQVKWFAYCVSALLSSVAGIFYICEVSVAEPQTLALGYELNAIAAAVVGGCSLQGGVGTVPGTLLGTVFLRLVIDGVAKVIKTGSKVYEGLIVGVVVVFAVAFSQVDLRRRKAFFAGPLGLVAAINLALFAGTMSLLIGPTLLEGWTTLSGSVLGCWSAAGVLLFVCLLRSRLTGGRFALALAGLAAAMAALIYALNLGVPVYRIHAATAAVRSAGGAMTGGPEGWRVDLDGTDLDDRGLRNLAERLRDVPHVDDLSLAKTRVTDVGIASIKGLTGLKRINLKGTNVTRAGKTVLGRSLPEAEIID